MRTRKYINALLTLLILVSNMGLALNVHYCHGEVSSVSLAYKAAESCGGDRDEKKAPACGVKEGSHKKCCENDLIKLHDSKAENVIVKSLQLDLGAFCLANEWKPEALYYTEAPLVQKDQPSFYCGSHAPPLFKLYCQYIFYA